MATNDAAVWSGEERRTGLRLRNLIDTIYDRLLELRADISLHSSEIAQLRADLEEMRRELLAGRVTRSRAAANNDD